MTIEDKLLYKIFVDTEITSDELAILIASSIFGQVLRVGYTRSVTTSSIEIDVRRNDDYDEKKRYEFPNGFLYFRYYLEVYYKSEETTDLATDVVASILNKLWSHNIPAIASGDFTSELPHQGGYGSSLVPWVK